MELRSFIRPIAAALALGIASTAAAQTAYMGVDGNPPRIDEVDINTATVISSVPLNTGNYFYALSQDPTTGEYWAALDDVINGVPGQPDRTICKVDPLTGVVIPVGLPTAAWVNSLAFDSSGTLWATDGEGSSGPPSLWTVDLSTGQLTFQMNLTTNVPQTGGTTFAYNPDDGLLYRSRGGNNSTQASTGPIEFESIDPATLAVTQIPLSNPVTSEWLGLTYIANGTFLASDLDFELHTVTTAGVNAPLALWSEWVRGSEIVGGAGPVGTNYCSPAIPNSTGQAAVMSAFGSPNIVFNDVVLTMSQGTADFGYFLNGMAQGIILPPGSNGILCLMGSIGRHNQPGLAQPGPSFSITLDLNAIPQPNAFVVVQPGETWNFTAWYRDTGSSNFADGLEIQFQ